MVNWRPVSSGVRKVRRWLGLTTRCCLLLSSALLVQAKSVKADPAASFFSLTNVWEMRISLSRADWTRIESADPRRPGLSKTEYPWATCTFTCAGQTLSNVAVRCKGNSSYFSSRGGVKHPFKLHFNRGEKGRTFFGLKELSLNNNFNDATQFREALAYDACRTAGLPAPRTAFARVSLTVGGVWTNRYLGLYTVAEDVDGAFLESRFGQKKGLLLKPERVRSLEYLGPNWNAYTNAYQPKADVARPDAQRFMELTRLIAEADDATLERELPTRLDMDNFLRYVAVSAVLADYDSFVGNGHNYYLFQAAGEGKATFIPWDLNEAFGGHPMAGGRKQQADLSVLHPQAESNRLIERVLANPRWSAAYRRTLGSLLRGACDPGQLNASARALADLVKPAVFDESPAAKAYFQRVALGQADVPLPPTQPGPPGAREEMALSEWITTRMQNVTAELAGQRTATVPKMRGMFGRGGPPRGGPPPGGPPRGGAGEFGGPRGPAEEPARF